MQNQNYLKEEEKMEFKQNPLQEAMLKDIRDMKIQTLNWNDEQYFSDKEYLTNSMLSMISKGGVKHLQNYLINGNVQKKHNDVGNHFHTIVLEPDKVKDRFFVLDDRKIIITLQAEGSKNPRATNKYKDWRTEQLSEAKGRIIIDYDDHYNNECMANELNSHRAIRELIASQDNLFEKVYHDVDGKIKRKGKIDIRNFGNYIADLKGSRDPITPQTIRSTIIKYGYDRQAAYYCDLTGEEQFYFVMIEKTYPFTCGIVEMSAEALKTGREKYQRLQNIYREFFVDKVKDPDKYFLMDTF